MKLLFLILGLAIGFGGGVWWGVKNPTKAADLATLEEQWVLKGKIEATEAIKSKLDRVIADGKAEASKRVGVGFVSGKATAGPDPGVVAARDDTDRELDDLKKQLAQAEKK